MNTSITGKCNLTATLRTPYRPASVLRSKAARTGRVLGAAAEPAKAEPASSTAVTIEYQRQQAKAMQKYLRDQSLQQEIADAQVFGWTRKNELGNGRWVMMGLAVGLLTEYATGVSFIDQLKLMVSYMGVIDLD